MSPRQWCKKNRQWKREHNIAHAKLMLAQSDSEQVDGFWISVLNELGVCDE